MFFGEENNSKVLADFIKKADIVTVEDETKNKRLKVARQLVGYMYKSPEGWDKRCSFNIKHVGDQFLQWLKDFDHKKPSDIDHIYCLAYRFLCEFDFLIGAGKELSIELRTIKNKIQSDNGDMDGDIRSQIIYASYVMPANIAKEFINDANIGVFKNFEDKIKEANRLKEQWDKELESKRTIVDKLKEKLTEYEIGFNFVGLYQGFSDLTTKKKREAFLLLCSLLAMGALIIAPLIVEILLITFGMYKGNTVGIERFFVFFPIVALEIVLIYFFRVILINHRSVKAQIIQIELRQTLCQFIQSYADYSSEIKKKDGVALEKFESLIFSGIISDPEKLPSTFDGIEQIGKVINNIKKS
ncbi:MAG: hypothetical protein KKD01_01275 [Proteobacteria bacterium]|nr:hypothetical protein [Pseudomonadota bacterium]MBU1418265.1 hypothetical protein [Pseudomonadota bacterium]MBU1453331.1 hypothetical protein [Pseudomonadota bacterium]